MSNQDLSMPSQETRWFKDKAMVEFLDGLRQSGQAYMSQCYFCDQKSHGIKAIGYQLFPVCPNHDSPNHD